MAMYEAVVLITLAVYGACPPACLPVQEAGYNGIHFNQVAHSWVRDVRLLNSDSAFYSWGMVFCTISGLEVASGNRGYDNGHR